MSFVSFALKKHLWIAKRQIGKANAAFFHFRSCCQTSESSLSLISGNRLKRIEIRGVFIGQYNWGLFNYDVFSFLLQFLYVLDNAIWLNSVDHIEKVSLLWNSACRKVWEVFTDLRLFLSLFPYSL